ncbi:hypothetical protein [Brucella thiophenivorans]|uniref:Uncharacterized protein n=1 Tax=Brucella thiophenivorans TaxID=571255 RepID=A0A256FU24_9HYPH|nr:hypothetical protein [Brucella thiophenivorans]OYR18250.1 hypothetical protein CEV31_4262 [Brucella thiophenivorans]
MTAAEIIEINLQEIRKAIDKGISVARAVEPFATQAINVNNLRSTYAQKYGSAAKRDSRDKKRASVADFKSIANDLVKIFVDRQIEVLDPFEEFAKSAEGKDALIKISSVVKLAELRSILNERGLPVKATRLKEVIVELQKPSSAKPKTTLTKPSVEPVAKEISTPAKSVVEPVAKAETRVAAKPSAENKPPSVPHIESDRITEDDEDFDN